MIHTITSVQHPLVKHLVRLLHNRDYRYERESLVVEGLKPIEELAKHVRFKTIVAEAEGIVPKGVQADEVIVASSNVMRKISAMESPEGLIAEVPMPPPADLSGKRYIIAFDGVSDPGNVGTLLRTALALGWDGAYLLNECCDPFNDKALRAARGATFRLPLAWGSWADLQKVIQKGRLTPVVADISGKEPASLSRSEGIVLILGNEAHGASEEVKKGCKAVAIPMPGPMESLNVAVAGGILMYALRHDHEQR